MALTYEVSLIPAATLRDSGFECKSCTHFVLLIINHFVTIMYYRSLPVNHVVILVFIS